MCDLEIFLPDKSTFEPGTTACAKMFVPTVFNLSCNFKNDYQEVNSGFGSIGALYTKSGTNPGLGGSGGPFLC